MKIVRINISNFRLLQNASIRMSGEQSTTILVGPNNSGKTSVAEALLLFTGKSDKRFSIYDFSIPCRKDFEKAQELILAGEDDSKATEKLPIMSMDLHFEYQDDAADLAVAGDLLMDLDPKLKSVTLRIEYAPQNALKLALDFRTERKGDECLFDFLTRSLHEYYSLSYFKITPEGGEKEPIDGKPILDKLIRVDFVFAQRHIDDQENSRATRLSHLLYTHYEEHYKSADPENHEQIDESLKKHADELGGKYMKAFDGLIMNLKQFGYPQKHAPEMSIRAELNSTTLFRDNTRIYYGSYADVLAAADAPKDKGAEITTLTCDLPEKYNGLGFKNLIFMILQIQSFRVALEQMIADRPRVHLIFIEEPETHLHPQVQSVFIKQLATFLSKDGGGKDVQIILTTHSPHIVADSGFTPIRYFRRKNNRVAVKDLMDFDHQLKDPKAITFLSKYMSLMRCDLFFADKAILVEGQVERLLLPKMIVECSRKGSPAFASEYISIIEVGGAHAHKFEHLLKFIESPTLIIADLDAVDANGKTCPVAAGEKTSNPTLKNWLPKKTAIGDLKAATTANKTDGCICVEYQCSEGGGRPCGRSFEEAFIYRNAEWLTANHADLVATGHLFKDVSANDLVEQAYDLNQKITKVDFALDLMLKDGWETPQYIATGLERLAAFESAR